MVSGCTDPKMTPLTKLMTDFTSICRNDETSISNPAVKHFTVSGDSCVTSDHHHPSSPASSVNDQPSPAHSIASSSSFTFNFEYGGIDPDDSNCSTESSPMQWPVMKSQRHNPSIVLSRLGILQDMSGVDEKLDCLGIIDSEIELMKERFAKLLLGEDMSGGGKGVCTALAISNAITNLYATVFGQHLKLEPLKKEKKIMWKREMECLLSVCDHMVEFIPTSPDLRDQSKISVMTTRPRSDIYINLPALQKLDAMLLEILDSFQEKEFWYTEQASMPSNSTHSVSFRRFLQDKEEKWWLPIPCVPQDGLSKSSRENLRQKRDCANQIHKAAMAINSCILAEMDIPESYIAALPKSGRACLGESIYRYMCTKENFSTDYLLDGLNIRSEHEALELADRVEASMYTWRRKACISHSKSSWQKVKELMSETECNDKNYMLAERADELLFSLKQRYPELSQTSLDACKIQHNQDVGQAVLESYSRVLEGLAFNIVAWIEDVLCVARSRWEQNP